MNMIMLLAIITTIALTGCASFIQTKNTSDSEINTGISYYLPKRQHNLVVTAENLNAKKEKEKFHEAELSFKKKSELATELKSKWEHLQTEAKKTPIGENGADIKARASAVERAQTAEGIYLAAQKFSDDAEQEMKEAESKYIQAKTNEDATKCNYYITMAISPLPLEPDTEHPFLLILNNSPLRDDELKVKTTHSGLLTSIDVTSADRTGDIAVEIAKAVAMFGIGVPAPKFPSRPAVLATPAPSLECYPNVLKHEEIVDFGDIASNSKPIKFKDSSGLEANKNKYTLPPEHLNVFINVQKHTKLEDIYKKDKGLNKYNENDQESPNKSRDQTVSYPLKGHYGVLYRRDATYLIELRNGESKIADKQISMPNLSPVSLLPYKYLPLVTTKNNAVFENGMLVSYETNRPSSALALVSLPAKVAEGYINALTNFLQLKIDYSSKEIAALNKEKELADLLKSLQDASKNQNP